MSPAPDTPKESKRSESQGPDADSDSEQGSEGRGATRGRGDAAADDDSDLEVGSPAAGDFDFEGTQQEHARLRHISETEDVNKAREAPADDDQPAEEDEGIAHNSHHLNLSFPTIMNSEFMNVH